MSNYAVIMCGCCMGTFIIILGVIESIVWYICFQVCLDPATFGGNYYLGLVTGLLAIIVGILGIAYLCILHSYLIVFSLLFDVPLVLASSICLIISSVNVSVERADNGDGVFLLIVQSVLASLIGVLSVIFAVQYCCIQNTSFNEEDGGDGEARRGMRRGPERYNPYVDDDARVLPNGRFTEVPRIISDAYHVTHPRSTPTGSNSHQQRERRNGGPSGNHSNSSLPRTVEEAGRGASRYLGRRSPRAQGGNNYVTPKPRSRNRRSDYVDPTTESLASFQLGPILGNFELRNSRENAPEEEGHVNAGADDENLPDFDLDNHDNEEARYRDNSNFYF